MAWDRPGPHEGFAARLNPTDCNARPGSPRARRDASGNQQIRCVATYQFDGLRQKPESKAKNKQVQRF